MNTTIKQLLQAFRKAADGDSNDAEHDAAIALADYVEKSVTEVSCCTKVGNDLSEALEAFAHTVSGFDFERQSERGCLYFRLDQEDYEQLKEAKQAWKDAGNAFLSHVATCKAVRT